MLVVSMRACHEAVSLLFWLQKYDTKISNNVSKECQPRIDIIDGGSE